MNELLEHAAKEYAGKYKTQVSSEGLENIADDFKAGAEWMKNQTKEAVSELIAVMYFNDSSKYLGGMWNALYHLDEEAYALATESLNKAFNKYCE